MFCSRFFFLGNLSAGAATATATPEIYKVTISKVEFYNSDTATWVTIGEGDMTFDVASVSAGAVVGCYISDTAIPEGTYTQIRVTLSRNITIKATGSLGGTQYTTATPYTIQGDTFISASTDSAYYAEGTYVIPSDATGGVISGDYFIMTNNFSSSLLVKRGTTKKVRVKFDVTNTTIFANASATDVIAYSSEPSVTIQIVD